MKRQQSSRPTRLLTLLVLLATTLLLAATGAGCGARPAAIPASSSAPWVASLLGTPSHLGVIVKPSALLADPYWGPAIRRGMSKPQRQDDADDVSSAQVASFMASAQMELFLSVRDLARAAGAPRDRIGAETVGYVLVIRGVGGIDPAALTSKRGERLFAPPVRLPTGVLEYAPMAGWASRKRGLATFIYVMPDGTWVGVDGTSAGRARTIYSQTAASPPRMTMDSEALLAGFVDRAVLDAASRRAELLEAPWKHDLTGGGLVLLGGHDGAIEIVLEYANGDAADRAKSWIEDLFVAACKEHEMACLLLKAAIRDVKISRDGRRVGVRFYLTEALLRKLSES